MYIYEGRNFHNNANILVVSEYYSSNIYILPYFCIEVRSGKNLGILTIKEENGTTKSW